MKKIAIGVVLLLLLFVPSARAESVKELIEEPARFDGKQVSFEGEVIGVMVRGDQAWVNIFDRGASIGVWTRAEDAKGISFVGDYTHRGDIVKGVGIYHVACLEHGGDTDIHASSFLVSEKGRPIERRPSIPLVLLSALVVLIAVFVSFYLWRIRKERKKKFPWPFY